MATTARQSDLASWIDRSLDYLMAQWEAIPEVAQEWDSWDELDRLDFVLEWPLRVDRLKQLRQWDAEGLLSPGQRGRLQELDRLMPQHQATLDRLLAD
jgi:hypothetical protein